MQIALITHFNIIFGLSLPGVVAHFEDVSGIYKTVLLGLQRLWEDSDGVNIASCMLIIISNFEISQLGTFMMGNARNNDTMMDTLELSIPTVSRASRLRYAGHIVNLIVKAILYGNGITAFTKGIMECSDDEYFWLWRQFEALEKVYNCVKRIMRSNQRRQVFTSLQAETQDDEPLFLEVEMLLVKDGRTKWNSTYAMLLRAFKLRRAIELYQLRHKP